VDVDTVRTRVRIARVLCVVTVRILWLRKEVPRMGPLHISLTSSALSCVPLQYLSAGVLVVLNS
jgi:hypothetical protein